MWLSIKNMSKKILVAVAWPYVNGDLHPGHLAGYLLPADIFARYHRIRGNDVLMVSGSDCHGTPTTFEADKEDKKPEEIVQKYHPKDMELFKLYNLSYSLYTKTTTQNHQQVVWEFFLDLLKKGYLEKGMMKQYYSPEDKKFLSDRYVEGECPYCHSQEQRSDQCEVCGRWLKGGEIINPKSRLSGQKVILKDTEHYFLDLGKLEKDLKEYVASKKDIWRNWVFKEAAGWLKEGLEKRAITRDINWGIELPVDEIRKLSQEKQLSSFEGKRIYVWFEAVIGYLSASIEWSQTQKENREIIFKKFRGQSKDWQNWWLDKDSKHYYFMGQDNLVFHTLMWPGQLMAKGEKYTLPHDVVVYKFWNYEGKKFSKSRNWTIDSVALGKKYGIDAVRFYLSSNFSENKEADFTWLEFQSAVNNELVANLGNFIHRTLKFIESKYKGEIELKSFNLEPEVEEKIKGTFSKTAKYIEKTELVNGLKSIMKLVSFGNKYFNDSKIWEVYKKEPEQAKQKILNLANIVYNLAILLYPYLPQSAEKLANILDFEIREPEVGDDRWQPEFISQLKLKKAVKPLFEKIEKLKRF